MPRKWTFAIAAVVALALGAGVFVRYRRSQPSSVKAAPAAVPAIVVPSEITLAGSIQPAHVVSVPVPIDGTIDEFAAGVGQRVSEGEVLARIRNPRLAAAQQAAQLDAEQASNRLKQLESALLAARLEVSRSEADATRIKLELDNAGKDFERQQLMFREGVTPRLAYEKAEHDYRALEAQAQRLTATARNARERVDSTTQELDPARKALAQKTSELEDAEAESAVGEVNSPSDGIVIARRGKPGQPVTPNIPDLFQIAADPAALEIIASVDPAVAARIHPGQPARIQAGGLPGSAPGTVRDVKSGQVFINLTEPSTEFKIGMAAQIKIKL